MRRQIDIVSAPFSLGGRHWGCNLGTNPYFLKALTHQMGHDQRFDIHIVEAAPCLKQVTPQLGDRRLKRSITQAYLVELAQICATVKASGSIPVVLGGDHTIAMGSWRGICYAESKPIGMLWVDAHLDSHNWESSDSGNLHGMPLAHLLGEAPLFTNRLLRDYSAEPVLDPNHTVVMGVRSFEPAEWQLVERMGLKVIKDECISAEGFAAQWMDALAVVSSSPNGYALSIDMDVFNPLDFEAVSVPEHGGLYLSALIDALGVSAGRFPPPLALEIVEYNPFAGARVRARNRKRIVSLIRALLNAFFR